MLLSPYCRRRRLRPRGRGSPEARGPAPVQSRFPAQALGHTSQELALKPARPDGLPLLAVGCNCSQPRPHPHSPWPVESSSLTEQAGLQLPPPQCLFLHPELVQGGSGGSELEQQAPNRRHPPAAAAAAATPFEMGLLRRGGGAPGPPWPGLGEGPLGGVSAGEGAQARSGRQGGSARRAWSPSKQAALPRRLLQGHRRAPSRQPSQPPPSGQDRLPPAGKAFMTGRAWLMFAQRCSSDRARISAPWKKAPAPRA